MNRFERKTVEDRLASIAKRRKGRLTPAAVVKDARSKKSPLHSFFEWDDSEAAHQYRLNQARGLIRSVRVPVTNPVTTVSSVKYVRDPSSPAGRQGYADISVIRSDKEWSRIALESELKRVAHALERAREVAVALDLGDELEALLTDVVSLRRLASELAA